MKIGIIIPINPGHPSLRRRMTVIPINAKGKVREERNGEILSSMMLKSLDSMLRTLNIEVLFIVY